MDTDDANQETDDREGGITIGGIYIPPPPLPACSFEADKPRLMISHVECTNFKSYANTVTVGPFHKNFGAVVGPNGNGKSNVIDALLFVFGYRASKIRTKKIGVLIHKSDQHPNLRSCSVRVHFQTITDKGSQDYEVQEDSKFSVSRTAFNDNTSFYQVNERRVQFKEVGKLLRFHGIDLDHNRFLILQGEIESISMMKPIGSENNSGMLEYLEDIIGSNRFIEPIKSFAGLIEQLNDERTEKLNRVKAATKDKEDTEVVRNEAIEYVKIENKVVMLEHKMGQIRLKEATETLEQSTTKRDKCKKSYDAVGVVLDELNKSRAESEMSYKDLQRKYDRVSNVVEECKEQFSSLERQDVVCRENINHSKAKLKKLVKSLETEEEKVCDLKKQPEVHEGEAAELLKKSEVLEKKREVEKKKLDEVMTHMREETEGIQEEKEKHEHRLIELKDIANSAKSEMDIAKCDLDLYLSSETKEKEKLKDLEEKYENTLNSLKEKQRLEHDAAAQTTTVGENIKNFENLRHQITEKEAKLEQEINSKRTKVEDAKSTLTASRSRNTVLQALMDEKNSGNITGILGRLGDLGAIDEKYDVAISTACGRLDNIVTDTIDTAQRCVEFLKRTNKGYATFIALDKMTRWIPYTKQKIATPENVPRLFDLVRVIDRNVLPAFYFALSDTLVGQNLDQATRIGLHGAKRYRVVTLNGELIEMSGTMSGGGTRVMRGRMGQSVTVGEYSARDVEKMSQNLDELIRSHASLREEQINLNECINQARKELSNLQHAAKKNAIELKTLHESKMVIAKQIEEQKPKIKAATVDKNRVAELQNRYDKTKKSFGKAQDSASKVEEKVEELHNQILAITKGKFGAVQKVVDKLTKEIDAIHANMTKCKVSAKSAVRNLKKSEDKVVSLTNEIGDVKKQKEKLMEEYKVLETKANEVVQKRDQTNEELKAIEGEKKDIAKAIHSVKEKEQELKSKNIELRNQLKSEEASVKQKSDAVKGLKMKLAKSAFQRVGDEEVDSEFPETLPTYTNEELAAVSTTSIMYEISALNEELSKMTPNMSAIADYRNKVKSLQIKLKELDDITNRRDVMKGHHDNLRKQRLDEFMNGFRIISSKLKEVYQMVTMGGDAELELMDSLDPFTEGIEFSVRPPKKSWKNISNLSGGEKTLSSLALVFALHYYKPTPFYVMDEIDAALDYRNVSIVAHYIKERTKNAQFIIISLRDNMYSMADTLVGIYKVNNCSHCIAISPHKMVAESARAENNQMDCET